MSHVPKRAQRAIDAANRQRQVMQARQAVTLKMLPPMRFMSLSRTPRNIINLYDIYFNDEKQFLCVLADVPNGMIQRWMHGKGNVPAKGSPLETLYGKVEIRLKTS